MIVLDLSCPEEHVFEGWFATSASFEEQLVRGLVSCPVCSSTHIRRLPSAPYVQTGAAARERSSPKRTETTNQGSAPAPAAPRASVPAGATPGLPEALAQALTTLRQLARSAEDVGERLPEEARRIHYGEAEVRNIRGAASRDEVDALLEEGIMVLPVLPPEEDLH
ncbi:DUF1178 family protein [Thauera sp.]|uniref:DUF1178 family protein n=1 Tax=Thauera sp. TaxID=1905334 RepID=UPI002B88F77B|nr:DUF1178 family protein [Thauera sp.]HRP23301.1 DUF1178 family protein [Thauera sp.]